MAWMNEWMAMDGTGWQWMGLRGGRLFHMNRNGMGVGDCRLLILGEVFLVKK